MRQGDDLRVIVEVVDQSGTAIDISDATEIVWQLSRTTGSAVLISKTLSGGDLNLSGTTGFFFDLLDTETDLVGSHYHEAELTTDQGLKYTVLRGRVRFERTQI